MAHAATAERHEGHQTQQADNRYTRKIAQFVSGLTYEKIPAEVRQRIKLLILDSLGCGMYGAIKEHSQIAVKGIMAMDDSKLCGLWGTNQRVSGANAALLNGTFVLPQSLQARALNAANTGSAFRTVSGTQLTLLTYGAPVSNDPISLEFKQPIAANDALRTGTYTKTLTYTLSTTTP